MPEGWRVVGYSRLGVVVGRVHSAYPVGDKDGNPDTARWVEGYRQENVEEQSFVVAVERNIPSGPGKRSNVNLIYCASSGTVGRPAMVEVAIAGEAAEVVEPSETDVRYTSFVDKPEPTGRIGPVHLDQSKAAGERAKAALDEAGGADNGRGGCTALLDKSRLDGAGHR